MCGELVCGTGRQKGMLPLGDEPYLDTDLRVSQKSGEVKKEESIQ
jgi:hypothetical protein